MNIREELLRHLNETGQVMQTRRYKWLSAIGLILVFASIFHVFEPDYWQLRRVRRHISDISPQWDAFKRANPGFEAVELYPGYDGAYGVRFAAKGSVPWNVDLNRLYEFMRSTKPPVAVDFFKVMTALPATKKMTLVGSNGWRIEADVVAETNSTSSSAGPRR